MGRLVNVKPTDSIEKLNKDYKLHRHRVKFMQKMVKVTTKEKRTIDDQAFTRYVEPLNANMSFGQSLR